MSSTMPRSFPRTPAAIGPSATTQAPVRVARSIASSRSGRVEAYDRASARTSRPSASVLRTSTVLPFMILRMSPGRRAPPPGMFSAIPMKIGRAHAELQSHSDLVCRLLLEKKKKKKKYVFDKKKKKKRKKENSKKNKKK